MDDAQRQEVADDIKRLRKERGWSQAKLAEEARVDEDTVAAAESGRRRTQEGNLRAILDALDIEPTAARLVLTGLPEDVDVFVRVVAERLRHMDSDRRAHVLADLYPRLLTHGD
jgi:transcriptional regulator with XRE-family HTH domain